MQAMLTKVRPGNIAEGIKKSLQDVGYSVSNAPSDWNAEIEYLTIPRGTNLFVNCTGKTESREPDDWARNDANKIIFANLTSAIELTSQFVEQTKDSTGAKTIIHIGSLWSRKHGTNNAVYCAAKAGLAHFVSCVAHDLYLKYGKKYVVIGIHPGNVQGTPMTEKVKGDLMAKRGMDAQQIDKIYKDCITPTDIGEIITKVNGCHWLSGENIYLGNYDKR